MSCIQPAASAVFQTAYHAVAILSSHQLTRCPISLAWSSSAICWGGGAGGNWYGYSLIGPWHLSSQSAASEMSSLPRGHCFLPPPFIPHVPGLVQFHALLIYDLWSSPVNSGWWSRMEGEGAPHALLIQVLKGYEVNDCPYWRHCNRIVGDL